MMLAWGENTPRGDLPAADEVYEADICFRHATDDPRVTR